VERKTIITKDGSHSISIPGMNVTYHSIHGAIQESLHVFIEAGFTESLNRSQLTGQPIALFEMGLGTGLNVLLTMMEAEKNRQPVHYTAVELYPLDKEHITALNYCRQLNRPGLQTAFEHIHGCEWEKDIIISPFFTLHKTKNDLANFSGGHFFDLVYFDAFAPAAQPELWTTGIFQKLYDMMNENGLLVTYCSKGEVRRAMQAAGFTTEKIAGPTGKREMLKARKESNKT
jgi:tRNA U34 5-methylaminomethyl-2-thiouridine-forming methyltransferase MnmC